MTVILLSTLCKSTFSEFYGIYSIFAADLIKKPELESDEARPLYMDFQATTPMVTITPMLVFFIQILTVEWSVEKDTQSFCLICVLMSRIHVSWMPCCPTKWIAMVTLTPEHMPMAGRVRQQWRPQERYGDLICMKKVEFEFVWKGDYFFSKRSFFF